MNANELNDWFSETVPYSWTNKMRRKYKDRIYVFFKTASNILHINLGKKNSR